jgi:hypothetical protein
MLLAGVLLAGAPTAGASATCTRSGERALATSARLVLIAPSDRSGSASDVRIVCRRDSGTRRTLLATGAACTHCVSRIERVVLHGRFAHAVVSRRAYNDQEAELVTLDTKTWRTHRAALDLGDQDDIPRTDVTDVIAVAYGRVVLRVRNDFAAGIVLAGPGAPAYLDEGLASAIGQPRVRGTRAVWRHGTTLRSSRTLLADRCPRPPAPQLGAGSAGYSRILGTADAVTSGRWSCMRATGRVGRLDGVVVRLLGPLAVVQRPGDVRVVDLRARTTVAGPVASDAGARSSPGVGRSGTLVIRRPGACAGDAEIVAIAPAMAERRLACGDLRDLRYEDGLVRYRDHATGTVVTTAVP